jgi:hypothetical protein
MEFFTELLAMRYPTIGLCLQAVMNMDSLESIPQGELSQCMK